MSFKGGFKRGTIFCQMFSPGVTKVRCLMRILIVSWEGMVKGDQIRGWGGEGMELKQLNFLY